MIATTTVTALMASVSEASSPMFTAVTPYIWVAAGIGLAFYIANKVIGMIPKGKK